MDVKKMSAGKFQCPKCKSEDLFVTNGEMDAVMMEMRCNCWCEKEEGGCGFRFSVNTKISVEWSTMEEF